MLTAKETVKKPSTRGKALVVAPDWLQFPTLSKVFQDSPRLTIARLEAKHNEFRALAETGLPTERVRARLISVSYAHACALLRELDQAQLELAKNKQLSPAKAR
jgi:hypothetical protein